MVVGTSGVCMCQISSCHHYCCSDAKVGPEGGCARAIAVGGGGETRESYDGTYAKASIEIEFCPAHLLVHQVDLFVGLAAF